MTAEKPTELSYNPHMPLSQALLLPRIVIENTMPTLDGGQFAVKAVVGQEVVVTSKVFADGHDKLAVRVRWRTEDDEVWHSEVMSDLGNNGWQGGFRVEAQGRYVFCIEAWVDLFAITVFAGRVWCGYTCPQSSWTWIFMWCEKITEGERNQRIKLQAAPWGLNKLMRRSAKHTLWLAISLLTGLTFVGYFTPIRPLAEELLTLQLSGVSLFWVLFFTGATYINAGWLREAVCMHMCPYARFQSVMFDKDTLTIAYDVARGENRGPRKREVKPAEVGLGDCIDCQLCVQVCPTGIDIRDGLQMECIGCAACIDACDSIMDKMGYERGLISYTSEHQLQGGKTRLLRPRLIGYTAVLVVMIAALVLALMERPMVSLDVTKDRGLFRENSQGQIENIYSLKVINKTQQRQDYRLTLVDGEGFQLQGKHELSLAPGEIVDVPVSVAMTTERASSSSRSISFKIIDSDEPAIFSVAKSRFVAPMNR